MEPAYSPPTPLPPTAPLRLTPKSPHTTSFPTRLSSKTGSILPVSVVSSSVRRTASNSARPPTPSPAKRMKSTSVLQQAGAFSHEGNYTFATREAPVTTPRVRQGHVGGKLSRRLSELVSLPKGRTTGSAELGFRIDMSTSSCPSSKPKNPPSMRETLMEDSVSSPGTITRATSPTPTRRRRPFASGSHWPRSFHTNHSEVPQSPSSSSDSGLSSEELLLTVEKKPVLPRRGILKNKGTPSHQRSISVPISTYPVASDTLAPTPPIHPRTVAFALDNQPVVNFAVPARDSNPPDIPDNQQRREGERDRAMSELLEALFMSSSRGNSSSSVSWSTTNQHLDVSQIAIEQSTSAPSIFTRSFPWTSSEVQVDRRLQTKRSSPALPQATREANVVKLVAPMTQTPSPPATPVLENIFPIEEKVDNDIFDVRDICTSKDGKLGVSILSDDQWTLRAESINDGSAGQKLDGNFPRYSELLSSPTDVIFRKKKALTYQFIVEEKPKPGSSLIDEDFTIERALSKSSDTVRCPPVRSTSLPLPVARRLRSVSRTELQVESARQQWDPEKFDGDAHKVAQGLCWDKVHNTWYLAREAEHAPVTVGQIPNAYQDHTISRNSIPSPQSAMVAKGATLPPGRMEWATVDSASPDPTDQPGFVFRLCIAWRLATRYNAINHPFGAQEEIKVFVLGRTHEEFYHFYEGLMARFMLEPQRHPFVLAEELGPRARASFPPMEPPINYDESDSTFGGGEVDRMQEIGRKVDMLESWTQGFMKLKGTKMGFVLESDYVRLWMAPRREGDCERSTDNWRKGGLGKVGPDSEGIARVLERLW